jgi:ribonuclease HI
VETIPLLSQERNNLVIYGKSYKSTAGIAIGVVCFSASTIIHTFQETLSTNTTEDKAELSALLAAVKYAVSSKNSYAKCAILCSSISALNNCTKNPEISEPAAYCRKLCYDNQNYIHHYLVRGTEGTSLAREEAKSCLQLNSKPINHRPCSLGLIKETIKTKLGKMWAHKWLHSSTCTRTKEFFPRPTDATYLKNSYIHHELTEVLTGHCRLNHHLQKIKKSHPPYVNVGKIPKQWNISCFTASVSLNKEPSSLMMRVCETKSPFHLHLMSSQRTKTYGMHSKYSSGRPKGLKFEVPPMAYALPRYLKPKPMSKVNPPFNSLKITHEIITL